MCDSLGEAIQKVLDRLYNKAAIVIQDVVVKDRRNGIEEVLLVRDAGSMVSVKSSVVLESWQHAAELYLESFLEHQRMQGERRDRSLLDKKVH